MHWKFFPWERSVTIIDTFGATDNQGSMVYKMCVCVCVCPQVASLWINKILLYVLLFYHLKEQ